MRICGRLVRLTNLVLIYRQDDANVQFAKFDNHRLNDLLTRWPEQKSTDLRLWSDVMLSYDADSVWREAESIINTMA